MFDAFANLVVYQWLGQSADSHAGAALHFFVMLVIVIYPW